MISKIFNLSKISILIYNYMWFPLKISNINGYNWKEKYNDETTKFMIRRNGQPYTKHAPLCYIFTDKYSYFNLKEMHDTLYCLF